MRIWIALCFLGCATAEAQRPAPSSPERPSTPSSPPTLEHRHPEGAIAFHCTLRAEIEAELVGDEVHLKFLLQNIGTEPHTVTLRGACPGGLVELTGAGPDPMHRCQAGACREPTFTRTITVPGGRQSVEIGETVIRGGGDACNPPLPKGSTFLQASIVTEPRALDVCGGGQVHLVRDPATLQLRRAGLLDPLVPAFEPPPPAPRPSVKPAPASKKKDCPTCGFGCVNGIPSSKTGPDGCPVCGCEDVFTQ